jgi:two-component system LytT family response regulator
MKKLAIIDDEKDSRQYLNTLIRENFPNEFVIGEADSVNVGINLITSLKPEIVLLDIHLEDGSGFDLLNKIELIDFEIIFVTAYDKYAIKAFQLSAIGYLLKPIDENDLIKALKKALTITNLNNNQEKIQEKINKYFTAIDSLLNHEGQILLPDSNGFYALNVKDIIRIQGSGSYSEIYLVKNQKLISSFNLSWFENFLEKYRFFRISKSHLINLTHLSRFSKTDGGIIYMSDQTSLSLSPQRKELFKSILNLPNK